MENPLVGRLLDALLDPQDMTDVLRLVASEFSADHLFGFMISCNVTGTYASRGSEELKNLLLTSEWSRMNPRLVRALDYARSGRPGLLTDWRLFTPQEVASNPFEQDFARTHGAVHFAGSVVPTGPSSFFVLSFERGGSKGFYVGSEEQRLARFLGEAGRALRYALRGQAHLARSLVDALGTGDVVHAWLDHEGRLRHASPDFELVMDRFLGERNGRLVPLADEPGPLHGLVAAAAAGARDSAAVELRNPLEPADVALARAVPLRTVQAFANMQADVLLSIEVSPRAREGVSEALASHFGLTPAETRLALRLNEGQTLRQAACSENISYETARTRLKVVFHKLSVSRQSELVRLLCSL